MSWSNFVWDPNVAKVVTTLTTDHLAYDNESAPQQANLRCDVPTFCGTANCCVPSYQNQCNAIAPELIVFSTGMRGISTRTIPLACCCGGEFGCTCDGYQYTCGIDSLEQICGAFNGVTTCSIGLTGVANSTGTKQGTDWAINAPNDYAHNHWDARGTQHQGWVRAVYSYDFTNYNINNAPNGPFVLKQWILDIIQGKSAAAPNGMDPTAATRIRDSHIVYGVILDCLNQLYNDGYYSQNPNTRQTFQGVDFLTFGFQTYINTSIFNLASYLQSAFPTGIFPDAFVTALTTILQPPLAKQLPKAVYQVSFQLSYPQYLNYQAASDKGAFISGFLANMLRDTEGNMGNLTTGREWSPDDPILSNPQVDGITAIELWNSASAPNYIVTTGIDPADWAANWGTKYPNYMFATAQVTGTITKWSPLLAIYFQIFADASFDAETCQAIASPPQSGNPGTLPVSCYQADCLDPAACKTDVQKYCPITYVPPPYSTRTTTDNYLVSNKFSDCYCYTSALAPISDPSPGNIGAMCFDNHCTPQFRQEFDLNDSRCKQYCQTVYGWLTGTGANQSQNASHMDWQRFNQICGSNYRPYTPASWNTSILVSGFVATLLSGLLTFAGSQHKGFTASKTKWTVGLVCIVLLAITFFFARDFAGLSGCDYGTKKFQCTSRITKRNIPKQFCNYVLNCECSHDEDCPNGCLCASGSCQPQSGTRGFKIVQTRNIPMLIISGILFVLFTVALFSLYKEEHWAINKFLFMGGVIGVGIIPLLYLWFKKTPEQVFSESCKKGGVCQTDSDCSPGTVCIGGQCEALQPGCPVASPADPPSDVLPTGSYIIQTKDQFMYLYPMAERPAMVSTNADSRPQCSGIPVTPPIWAFDTGTTTLTSVDAQGVLCTMIPYDICAAKGCTGSIYCQDVSRITPEPKFLLGQSGTIYSLEARAYLIPDSQNCQATPCPIGNCYDGACKIYVTYTSDISKAQVWNFTLCDPATSCKTSCGVCAPFMTCIQQKCQVAVYQLQVFFSPDMTGVFDYIQLGPAYPSGVQYQLQMTQTASPANFVASYLPGTQQLTLWPQNDPSKNEWGLSYQCVSADCPNCCLYYMAGVTTPVLLGPDNQMYLGSIDDYTRVVAIAYSGQLTLLGTGDPQAYIPLYFKFVLAAQ